MRTCRWKFIHITDAASRIAEILLMTTKREQNA